MTSSDIKVPPVHSKDEIYRYIDLGLGRGVDGTDATPWLNKTSFQVRNVTPDNILGTDEGSSLQSFEEEVSSVKSQQAKMKTSVCIPKSPVVIGASAEFSRTAHSSRRSVGRKIINRTISFRDNFEDIPLGEVGDDDYDTPCTTSLRETQNIVTFEERLSSWLMEHLKLEWQTESIKGSLTPLEISSQSSTSVQKQSTLRDLSAVIEKGRREDMKLIANGCKKFVEYFRITHYVHSIQLGASEYQVMTQQEYNTAVSVTAKTSVQGIGGSETTNQLALKKKLGSKEHKTIGHISKEGKVVRCSYDEAVVNVFIRPITTLIKSSFLNSCMQRALMEYIDMQSDKSDGPFLISCGVNEKLYLSVHPTNNAVIATPDIYQASEFYIIPNDDTNTAANKEFHIIYKKLHAENEVLDDRESLGSKYSVLADTTVDDINSVSLYLNAPINVWGENQGPLYMQDAVKEKTSRFALNDRIISDTGSNPCSLETWIDGSEMFYIRCSRRPWRYKGYLMVRKTANIYITGCANDVKLHDNCHMWMLFRLIVKPPQKTKEEKEKLAIKHPSSTSPLSLPKEEETDDHRPLAQEDIPSVHVEDIELHEM